MSCVVDGEPAGGVVDDDVGRVLARPPRGRGGRARAAAGPASWKTGTPSCSPSCLELLHGGGAVDVGGHQEGLLAVLLELAGAAWPAVVVLPEPCRPTIMMPVGLPVGDGERGVDRAHQGLELVVADLDEVVLRRDLHASPCRS